MWSMVSKAAQTSRRMRASLKLSQTIGGQVGFELPVQEMEGGT